MTPLDLTGPQRPWPARLLDAFAGAQDAAVRGRGAWGPPPAGGDPGLLERLHGLFGADPARTSVTAGVRAFAGAWAGTTPRVLIERPGFAPLPGLLRSGPARVTALDWPELIASARELPEPGTLWLTSPGRNPDGRTLTGAEAGALGTLAARGHQVLVNRVYRWFSAAGPAVPGCWSVESLSKLCGGGARLGWVTGPEGAGHPEQVTLTGPATVWQRTWAGFLTPGNLRALRHACAEPTAAARDAFLRTAGAELGWYEGAEAGGTAVLLALDGLDEAAAVELFAAHGLRVSPGTAFEAPAPSVRLAFTGVTAPEATAAAHRLARLAVTPTARGRLTPVWG